MTTQATGRYAVVAAITCVLSLVLLADVPVAGYIFSYPGYGLPYLGKLPQRAGSLALADFTGDGQMDAVIPGLYIAGVAVVANNTATWLNAGAWPVAVAAGDFDGDGDADLAVCERDGGGVEVFTNEGTGGMTRRFYASGAAPEAVLAVDLDQDGRLDLLVAHRSAQTVVVLHNTGGGFVLQQTVAVASDPNALVAADIDGDGWLEVAAACAMDDTVKVLQNRSGILSLAGTFEGGPYPVAVAAADLNGDGFLDLAAADREAPQVTVLLNDGTGQFVARDVLLVTPGYTTFEPPVDVQLVDTNGDGKIDMRCVGKTLLNDGVAHFTVSQSYPSGNEVYAKAFLPGHPYPYLGVVGQSVNGGIYGDTGVSVTYQVPPTGDVNRDGRVNVVDVLALADSWGRVAGYAGFLPACDLDHNGAVNTADLLIVAENWGK